MLRNVFCAAFLLLAAPGHAQNKLTIEGYYWRDYAGAIPKDAFRAGSDYNGQAIYIGQALVDKYLFTTIIRDVDKKAYYSYGGGVYEAVDNMKIFCTQESDHMEWLKTKISELHLITDKHVIVGGYEPGCTTYIGRVFQDNETSIGRVSIGGKYGHIGLLTANKDEEKIYPSFEILTYNLNRTNLERCMNFGEGIFDTRATLAGATS